MLLAFAGTPSAQDLSDSVRAQVRSARLGAGYAQMVNLSATPDISAASYRIDGEPDADLGVLHAPYRAQWREIAPDADLYWKVAAGWLQMKQDLPVALLPGLPSSIDSRWSAAAGSAGLLVKYRLASGFTLEPALDVGLARLTNRADYSGAAVVLQPFLDGLLFNWNVDAWFVTPSIAVEWSAPMAEGKTTVRGHVARSWIGSFDEADPVLHFNETANVYSVRAEYVRPTARRLLDRPLNWVGYVGYAGFFGANRDALGFDSVAEVGGGLEVPIAADRLKAERLRLNAAYLFGSGVRGWTVGFSLQY
jgi:hypothetical protein